jgi:uroporphyrinogen decarboxylase
MHFQPAERAPMIEVGCWQQTRDRWLKEGMPPGTGLEENTVTFIGNEFFGLERLVSLDLNCGMVPPFETEVLAEDERTVTARSCDGAVMQHMKDGSSMPRFLSFPIQAREDFEEVRFRYDPASPERMPPHWGAIQKDAASQMYPVWGPGVGSIGLYSRMRIWMGTENACTVFYDDASFAHEMADFIADFIIALMERALKEISIDFFSWFEDFSFKNGPLVSPNIYKEFLLPRYRRVNDWLREKGVDLIMIDTDGDPRVLIPLLLASGINCLYPLEQCKEEMNPVRLRKEYGRDLLLWGGIDKRALAKDKKAIDDELQAKAAPLMGQGGFIPMLDHLAPPDIPYENWLYYLEAKRAVLEGRPHG